MALPSSRAPSADRHSLPAIRERLVKRATRAMGREPKETSLRCVPVHRRSRSSEQLELVEWRATFEADAREWSAAGADKFEALEELEDEINKDAERAAR
jgi:hypothetical protein